MVLYNCEGRAADTAAPPQYPGNPRPLAIQDPNGLGTTAAPPRLRHPSNHMANAAKRASGLDVDVTIKTHVSDSGFCAILPGRPQATTMVPACRQGGQNET